MLSLEEERVVYSQAVESLFYCPFQLVLTQCFLSSPLDDLIHLSDSEEGLPRVAVCPEVADEVCGASACVCWGPREVWGHI